MNRRIAAAAASALCLCITGCGALVGVTWETVVVNEPTEAPAPKTPLAGIKGYLDATLKDPFSAQVQDISDPVKGYNSVTTVTRYPGMTGTTGEKQELRRWGWFVTAKVNAKNSYGGYVGWHTYRFVFRGEDVIYAEDVTAQQEATQRAIDRFVKG